MIGIPVGAGWPVAAFSLLAAMCVGLTACGGEDPPPPASYTPGTFGEPEDGAASLRASVEAVDAALEDAASALQSERETPEDVIRQVMACGSAPSTAAEVRGFGRLVGGDGPFVERLRAASDRLQAAGWTEAGSDLSDPDPGIGLTKGPAQLVLGGDIQPDGDAVGFSVRGSCYRTESGDAGRIGRTRTFDFAP